MFFFWLNSNLYKFVQATHLDDKHVVFGKVLKGKSVVRAIENNPTGANDKPIKKVTIVNCGELKVDEDDGVPVPADGDTYEDWPGNIF